MADEGTDVSASEEMSLCLRFVDKTQPCRAEVRKELIGFIQLENTYTDSICKGILDFLQECNLDIGNLRDRGMMGLQ